MIGDGEGEGEVVAGGKIIVLLGGRTDGGAAGSDEISKPRSCAVAHDGSSVDAHQRACEDPSVGVESGSGSKKLVMNIKGGGLDYRCSIWGELSGMAR